MQATSTFTIRESSMADRAAIETIYPEAFPEEDLLPVVRDLLRQPSGVLSLVAETDGGIIGHVIFTRCSIDEANNAALLGPLAVTPPGSARASAAH